MHTMMQCRRTLSQLSESTPVPASKVAPHFLDPARAHAPSSVGDTWLWGHTCTEYANRSAKSRAHMHRVLVCQKSSKRVVDGAWGGRPDTHAHMHGAAMLDPPVG